MSLTVPAPVPALAAGLDEPLSVLHPDGSRHASELLDAHLGDVAGQAPHVAREPVEDVGVDVTDQRVPLHLSPQCLKGHVGGPER